MMRIQILLVIVIAQISFAEEWHDAFEKGNQLYRDALYQEAADAYLITVENGMESGELYFNLGNTYYKLSDIGKSRLYYEKATVFLKNDEALQQNLEMIKLRLVDQIVTTPKFFLVKWWEIVLNFLSLSVLSWITLTLFVFFLFILAVMLSLRGRRRRALLSFSFRLLTISLVVFIVLLLNRIYIFETQAFAIILKPKVTVYASPDVSGTEVFILHEGTKVKLDRVDDDWFQVKLDDGKTGWLKKENLEKI